MLKKVEVKEHSKRTKYMNKNIGKKKAVNFDSFSFAVYLFMLVFKQSFFLLLNRKIETYFFDYFLVLIICFFVPKIFRQKHFIKFLVFLFPSVFYFFFHINFF